MSRSNIVGMGWASKDAFIVTFRTRDGVRAYQYDRFSGIAIMARADPHNYSGDEVSVVTVFEDVAENVEDLAELL